MAGPLSRNLVARGEKHGPLWIALFHLVWIQLLAAIPFGLFFGTLSGAKWHSYVDAYIASLFFGFPISLSIMTLERWILPRFVGDEGPAGRRMMLRISLYTIAGLVGAFTGALALRFTIAPHFLGSWPEVASIAMFTLLFMGLFLGIAMSTVYYRKALDRAGTERELQLARRIQRSFLLSDFPRRPRIEVYAVNVSSKEVSGDFYDVVPVGEHSSVFVIADVSGKGVPAALLSSMLQGLVRVQAGTTVSPAAAMKLLNALACQREATGQFATLFLAVIEEPTMTLRYSNAGHNPPVLLRRNERRLLETGGVVLGISPEAIYEEASLQLEAGDRLVLYTDGVTEAANAHDDMLGEDRLYAMLEGLPPGLEARTIVERVLEGVNEFLGEREAGDDITVMALRVLEPTAARALGPAPSDGELAPSPLD